MYIVILTLVLLSECHILTSNFTTFDTELAKYYLKFAGYAYCDLPSIIENQCCPELIDDDNWELLAADKIDIDEYNFSILMNFEYKKIVVALPGTRSMEQLITEILYLRGLPLKDNPTEKLMTYFYRVYMTIKEKISEKLKHVYLSYPDYQYIFTGHSLGGAMASIIALDSVKYGLLNSTKISPVLITYAQPRTGNDIFANEVMKYIPIVHRIVRDGDIVANLPFCYKKLIILGKECISILKDSKFDKDLQLDEEQDLIAIQKYFPWHIGGLKLFNDDMTEFVDCGNEFGENIENCKYRISLNIHAHTIYFGVRVRHMCK